MRSCSRSVAGVCAAGLFGLTGPSPGVDAIWKRPMSPQPPSTSAAHRAADGVAAALNSPNAEEAS